MSNAIKSASLTFVIAMAVGLGITSVAHAGKIDLGATPAVLTGQSEPGQEFVYSVQNTAKTATLNAKCTSALFEGTTQGQDTQEWAVTATVGIGKGEFSEAQGCTLGGIKMQPLMNGCKYTFTGEAQSEKTFLIDITGCTEGKQIEFKVAAGGCALKFPAQNGVSHFVWKQLSSQEATVEARETALKVQQSGGASCPDGATAHTGISATFSANTVVKAFQDKETKQVTKHGHQYTEHICGTQVQIQAT